MNDYLIDRETLSQFVDELIKNQALSVDTAEGLNEIRESAIKFLDEKIATAIFSQFNQAQNTEYRQLLNRADATEQDFDDFFSRAGLDLEKIIADAMEEFAKEFTKGAQNE